MNRIQRGKEWLSEKVYGKKPMGWLEGASDFVGRWVMSREFYFNWSHVVGSIGLILYLLNLVMALVWWLMLPLTTDVHWVVGVVAPRLVSHAVI